MAIAPKAVKKLKQYFLNEYCIIYLKSMNIAAPGPDGGEMQISAMIDGYINDIDEEFYYIGLQDGSIIRTISHDVASVVELVFAGTDEMSEDMPTMGEEVH